MHYLLCYDLAPDYLERRGQYRNEHLKLAWEAQERGELIMGGAFSDPADMSVLMFQSDSPVVVEQFAKADPYLLHGVVTGYKVRQWNTVVGKDAFTPLRPE
ncbi:YciI-like protein [Massilia pseudoviolaceinigra]|uniref:YciI-like protein n=1 Tax=Massilia pseudoviolaceinigra TaxID=3057165 RepID=UPI0027965989|nr:YciI-like protein [Massilia sp. CCM 9206]MDQ1923712.1 YciI-like protein [Massilia sp. CCM 9206]